MMSAARGRSSGRRASIDTGQSSVDCKVCVRDLRHDRAKREVSESRMMAARPRVADGRAARASIAWMRLDDGGVRDVVGGMRLLRCRAGPVEY